jgi:hypothetical protein
MKGQLIVRNGRIPYMKNGDARRKLVENDFVEYLTLTFTKSS